MKHGKPIGGLPRSSQKAPQKNIKNLGASRSPLPEDSLGFAMYEAAKIVSQVVSGKSLNSLEIKKEFEQLPDSSRRAVQDYVYKTLRNYLRAAKALEGFLKKPLDEPYQSLLYICFQQLEENRVEHYVVVDQAVRSVQHRAPGLKGVINAVLRNVLRDWQTIQIRLRLDPVANWKYPQWWIQKIRQRYPESWEGILFAGNTHPVMSLRVNARKVSREEMLVQLEKNHIQAKSEGDMGLILDTPLPISQVQGFSEGWVSVQDIGAQHAAKYLDLKEGQIVLDACAAPGGKAGHILECADVELIALEYSAKRAHQIQDNFKRLGQSATIKIGDAGEPSSWWDGRYFDRILVDAPCTGSGVVRRHPDIKWLREPRDIAKFAEQQSRILHALWQTLAPGGKMLYATCSIFDEENAVQVTKFCVTHKDAVRLLIEGKQERIFLPTQEHDGFYYALLQKAL